MKQELFGMRRANGDWFAMPMDGCLRMPVFRTLEGAWRARAKNDELMLFWPGPLTDNALREISKNDAPKFWLVDENDPAADLHHGRPLELTQIAILEGLQWDRKRQGYAC